MIPKYKVWDKELKQIVSTDDNLILQISKNGIELAYQNSLNQLTKYELLQSTGIKDMYGTEIYEGDVLHHKVQGTSVVYYPFRDNMASFGIRNIKNNLGTTLKDADKAGYEIIGNQFEHPHLLKE